MYVGKCRKIFIHIKLRAKGSDVGCLNKVSRRNDSRRPFQEDSGNEDLRSTAGAWFRQFTGYESPGSLVESIFFWQLRRGIKLQNFISRRTLKRFRCERVACTYIGYSMYISRQRIVIERILYCAVPRQTLPWLGPPRLAVDVIAEYC